MKTLILSCNTGEGHNSCSKAIQEYYHMQNEICDIQDGLAFISSGVSNIMSRGHSFVYCHFPWLFKCGYAYLDKHPSRFDEGTLLYRFLTQGSERLYRYILEGEYDTIICSHVFTALMMTDVLNKHRMNLSACFVATDYTCSPSAKNGNLEYYFIPDEQLSSEFECEHISVEKMVYSGIPVRQMFYESCPIDEAKKRVGVCPDNKHLLMMCGSMGCGPMKSLLRKLSKQLPKDWEITVICGKNTRLANQLKKEYLTNHNIHIQAFVEDMGAMLDSADLYLTKPGGISVSEASVKNVPMVFIDAVAGCESYNCQYFLSTGGAMSGTGVCEIVNVCLSLIEDEEMRMGMKCALQKLERKNSAQMIYEKMKIRGESQYETIRT